MIRYLLWSRAGSQLRYSVLAPPVAQELQTQIEFVSFGVSDERAANGWTVTAPGATVRDLHTYRALDAPAGLPEGASLTHGLTGLVIEVASPGDSVTVTVTAPGPLSPITRLWKMTPTCAGGEAGAWSWVDASSHAQGLADGDGVYSVTLTDGGFGDADCQENGLIVDPQAPGENPADIPTLAEWALIVLALFMVALAVWRLRRSPALRRGLAGLLVLFTAGALFAGLASSPLGIASHEPGESMGGQPMRSPLQPDASTAAATVVAEITADGGATLTSAGLHYRETGGTWVDVAAAPAPERCGSCWAATLPLTGFDAGEHVAYYLSATTDGGETGYLFDAANDVCAGVDCGDHGRCLGGTCDCDTGWDGATCAACATGYYGSACAACPDCGSHGDCHDGLGGDGQCGCDTGWAGATCATCATNYYGLSCAACPSCGAYGDCNDGLGGDGQCSCDSGYHGATCAYSCSDGAKNGAEEGLDCGGPCATSCPMCSGPLWIDNGNGTVTDDCTDLVWQNSALTAMGWYEADTYCSANTPNLPGSGWRLPTISELRSLVKGCAAMYWDPVSNSGGACSVTDGCPSCDPGSACNGCASGGGPGMDGYYMDPLFDNGGQYWFWAATHRGGSSDYSWAIGFHAARLISDVYYGGKAVRCVRTGP